jgi:hypothetical protein
MTAPAEVIAAISAVSWTISCLECGGTLEIVYDSILDCPVIKHCVPHRFGLSARALAESVQDELARHVIVADYGAAEPLNVVVTT